MLMEHHKSIDVQSQDMHFLLMEEPFPGALANKSWSLYQLLKLNTLQQPTPQKRAYGFTASLEKFSHPSQSQQLFIVTINQPSLSPPMAIFMLEPNTLTFDITSFTTLLKKGLSLLFTALPRK